MKRYFLLIIALLATLGTSVYAQQNQQLRRSKSPLLFPEFQVGKVRQSFGRMATDSINIYLKDASLLYKKDGKIMRAYVSGIYGCTFGDTLQYMRVDSAMARVVAQKGYNYLLCKTTVNMKKYREEESGGEALDRFELSDFNYFAELNQDVRDEDIGLPLQDKYYFRIQGVTIPANESEFKKFVSKDQLQAFKVLKENRFWSWRDAESLKMLLDFLPDETHRSGSTAN